MTKFVLFAFVTLGLLNTAKADTLDFWHVYYNQTKIEEYTIGSKGEILLYIKEIQKTDSLTIKYFNDTPCPICVSQVSIKNNKNIVITNGKGRGTFNPIKISVFDLLQYHLKNNEHIYEVFYVEEVSEPILIFKIKFK